MGAWGYSLAGTSSTERLKVGASVIAGAPMVVTAAAGTGIVVGTTTTWTDAVGLTLDAATYTTTQAADMIEGVARTWVSPMIVYKWKMSGGATEGTALLPLTNSVASTTGLTVTITAGETAGTNYDEGTLYAVSGANAGASRKITSVAATTATVIVPFANDIPVGDVFVMVPWTPFDVAGNNLQFTTALTEADQSIAVATGAPVRITRLQFSLTDARTDSYVYGVADDHVLNVTT